MITLYIGKDNIKDIPQLHSSDFVPPFVSQDEYGWGTFPKEFSLKFDIKLTRKEKQRLRRMFQKFKPLRAPRKTKKALRCMRREINNHGDTTFNTKYKRKFYDQYRASRINGIV